MEDVAEPSGVVLLSQVASVEVVEQLLRLIRRGRGDLISRVMTNVAQGAWFRVFSLRQSG